MELLTPDEITEINNNILIISKRSNIEYINVPEINTRTDKLHTLCKSVPTHNLLDTAVYYLKNLILLQIYPDGNHRTALLSVICFYHKNNMNIKLININNFIITVYKLRFKIYNSYEESSINIIYESLNKLDNYIKYYIECNLATVN